MKVVCLCTYPTYKEYAWRDAEHCASALIKAVKGEPFKSNNTIRFPIPPSPRVLMQSNADKAAGWFAEWLSVRCGAGRFELVPMPSSDTTVTSKTASRVAAICGMASARSGGRLTVADVLRFDVVMQAARKGGSRDAATLYSHLVVRPGWKPTAGIEYILVDDVMTSGGHMSAAMARLGERGVTLRCGLCLAKTDGGIQAEDPLAERIEEAEVFVPTRTLFP